MASRSLVTYGERASSHPSPLVRELFRIAESKKTNVVLSADLTTTVSLLDMADRLGPYIAVLKTHIDIVSDFGAHTIEGLQRLSKLHDFLIFEDRKFVDIGHTVQLQYHGGVLRIAEWAHIVNASILAGPGIIEALAQTASSEAVLKYGHRGLLILAEMTSKGSLAVGDYTKASVQVARQFPGSVIGFVSTTSLNHLAGDISGSSSEDMVTFTTGVNRASTGDALGQQYNTPARAVAGGADFIIAGRGIYAAKDPVESVKLYQEEGWAAYLQRVTPK